MNALPYAILTLLVIRGSLLEGAGEGIKFYLRPRIDRLGHVRTWLDAFNQIIYSWGIGTGQMVAYGSYTESNEDIVLDAGCISLLNSFTSLYAGVAVFAMLGHKANKDGSSVADVVQSGEGLAFVAIPDGLSELPAAGLWCSSSSRCFSPWRWIVASRCSSRGRRCCATSGGKAIQTRRRSNQSNGSGRMRSSVLVVLSAA